MAVLDRIGEDVLHWNWSPGQHWSTAIEHDFDCKVLSDFQCTKMWVKCFSGSVKHGRCRGRETSISFMDLAKNNDTWRLPGAESKDLILNYKFIFCFHFQYRILICKPTVSTQRLKFSKQKPKKRLTLSVCSSWLFPAHSIDWSGILLNTKRRMTLD